MNQSFSTAASRCRRILLGLVLGLLWTGPNEARLWAQEAVQPASEAAQAEPAGEADATLLTSDDLGQPILESPLDFVGGGPERWTSPEGLSSSLQIVLLLTVLSLAPALLLMTTCYVRIIIVLGLLRQAIGLQSLPPSQVMTSVALFMTLFVMTPVWKQTYDEAIVPYTDPETSMSSTDAWERGVQPIRDFMARQIDVTENHDDVLLFYRYVAPDGQEPQSWDEIPLRALLPAYMLSELKTAFLMGFQIYLPFLIVDLVVASVTISMGMLMLPPAVISLPFKLLLFVLVDGWHLVVQMLMSAILIGSPILLVGMVVGLLIGLIQALTQVQDQTVSFVPKIFAMAVVMVACLPWVVQKMVDLTRTAIENAGMP